MEAFDELDSCNYYSALRDSAISGLEIAVIERDLLLTQKDANYTLLLSSKQDLQTKYDLKDNQFKLSEENFKLLRKKKTKQLIGGTVGSFILGAGVGVLVGFLK